MSDRIREAAEKCVDMTLGPIVANPESTNIIESIIRAEVDAAVKAERDRLSQIPCTLKGHEGRMKMYCRYCLQDEVKIERDRIVALVKQVPEDTYYHLVSAWAEKLVKQIEEGGV